MRHVWQALNMAEKRSLLELTVGSIEYDFREDDDSVQGTWDIRLNGEHLTIEYLPFSDSPYQPARERYRIVRVDGE